MIRINFFRLCVKYLFKNIVECMQFIFSIVNVNIRRRVWAIAHEKVGYLGMFELSDKKKIHGDTIWTLSLYRLTNNRLKTSTVEDRLHRYVSHSLNRYTHAIHLYVSMYFHQQMALLQFPTQHMHAMHIAARAVRSNWSYRPNYSDYLF